MTTTTALALWAATLSQSMLDTRSIAAVRRAAANDPEVVSGAVALPTAGSIAGDKPR
jgi:hypothetical protein